MDIDRRSLSRLLSLNDRQLVRMIEQLASENGIDLESFNVSTSDVAGLRQALGSISDEDLNSIAAQYEAYRRQKR